MLELNGGGDVRVCLLTTWMRDAMGAMGKVERVASAKLNPKLRSGP